MRSKLMTGTTAIALALLGGCAAPAPEPIVLRVMSYNIRHGEGLDHRLDLQRIAEVIRRENPHLVALQEVDRGVQRTDRQDQPAELGKLTGMQSIFEKNIPYQGGEYGNAVLSSLPVREYRNHYLPQSLPGEQRGMLEVEVMAGSQPVRFFATHLDYHADDGERMASVRMFRDLAAPHQARPLILAGDLNATPDSAVLAELLSFMRDTFLPAADGIFTFPANRPDRRIDYILHNQAPGLTCTEYRVIAEPLASDHRPIVAVFRLSNASGGGN